MAPPNRKDIKGSESSSVSSRVASLSPKVKSQAGAASRSDACLSAGLPSGSGPCAAPPPRGSEAHMRARVSSSSGSSGSGRSAAYWYGIWPSAACVIMPLKAIIASRPFLSSASRREGVSSFHGSRP